MEKTSERLPLAFDPQRIIGIFAWAWLVLCPVAGAASAESLHATIDRLLEGALEQTPPEICDDATFLRRLWLSLAGRIPAAAKARAFLEDQSPNKREALLEAVLASSHYVEHMANRFDILFLERRGEKHVKAPGWQAFLRSAFAENKPYDQLVFEILNADGADPKLRARARFLLEREGEPHAMTRDVGRILFGMDLQCAQCHDHPRIDGYLQGDYHGLLAFFNRTYLFQPDPQQPGLLGERAEGEVTFESVFTKRRGRTRPRLPGGFEVAEPVFIPGEDYRVPPDAKDKQVRPIPRYSRRAALARQIAREGDARLARNIVNRLWRQMMGRALVEPVDFMHPDNPPTHPALLELLASAFVESEFDIKAMLGELARTRAFQRPLDLEPVVFTTLASAVERAQMLEAAHDGHRAAASAAEASYEGCDREHTEAHGSLAPLREEWEAKRAALAEVRKPFDDAAARRRAALARLADQRAALPDLAEALARAEAAAKRLATDEELAAAAQTLRKKLDQLPTAIAEGEEVVVQAERVMATTREKMIAPERAFVAASGRLEAGESVTSGTEIGLRRAREALEARRAAAAQSYAELLRVRKRVAYAQLLDDENRVLLDVATVASEAQDLRAIETALGGRAGARQQDLMGIRSLLGDSERRREVVTARRHAIAGRLAAARDAFGREAEQRALTRALTHLSPEQLAWSMMTATGYLQVVRQEAETAVAAKPQELKVEAVVAEKIAGPLKSFVRLFGGMAGQPQTDFFATVDQALFFSNGGTVRAWLKPRKGNLIDRLSAIDNAQVLAEELYLSILTRFPDAEERKAIHAYLQGHPNRGEATKELAWALLTAVEFRFF